MGNFLSLLFGATYDSEYSVAEELEQRLTEWTHDRLVKEHRPTVYVDAGVETMVNRFNNKYTIMLDDQVHRNCRLALLFPSHPQAKYRVLWTPMYNNLRTLSKIINTRLKACLKRQMCVACENSLYVVDGIESNVYIVWASYVNVVTPNEQETRIADNVPLFIEMDGEGRYRSVFVFPRPKDPDRDDNRVACLRVVDCNFLEFHQDSIFCLESDPRQPTPSTVRTISREQAVELATNPVARLSVTMDQEAIPFASSEEEL